MKYVLYAIKPGETLFESRGPVLEAEAQRGASEVSNEDGVRCALVTDSGGRAILIAVDGWVTHTALSKIPLDTGVPLRLRPLV